MTQSALLGALLIVVQFALSFVYGLELVTLLLVSMGAALPRRVSMGGTLVFCTVRNLLYPIRADVLILYLVFFPLMMWLLSAKKNKSAFYYAMFGVCSVLLFDLFSVFLIWAFYGTPLPALLLGQMLPTAIRVPVAMVSILTLFPILSRFLKRWNVPESVQESDPPDINP